MNLKEENNIEEIVLKPHLINNNEASHGKYHYILNAFYFRSYYLIDIKSENISYIWFQSNLICKFVQKLLCPINLNSIIYNNLCLTTNSPQITVTYKKLNNIKFYKNRKELYYFYIDGILHRNYEFENALGKIRKNIDRNKFRKNQM